MSTRVYINMNYNHKLNVCSCVSGDQSGRILQSESLPAAGAHQSGQSEGAL